MNDAEEAAAVQTAGEIDRDAMVAALAEFLRAAGLPDAAAGEAPEKAAAAWADELLVGYRTDPVELLSKTWPDETDEIVAITAIPFVSVCAHHLLPFYGRAHLAYIPGGRITGLSRLTALVGCLARRLQVQERLTEELCEALMRGLEARGAACLLEASHDCVGARRLEHHGSRVQTLAYRGEFAGDRSLQNSFLQLVLGGAAASGERSTIDGPRQIGGSASLEKFEDE